MSVCIEINKLGKNPQTSVISVQSKSSRIKFSIPLYEIGKVSA